VQTASGISLTIDRPSGGPEERLRPGETIEVTLPAEQLRLLAASS
jgi:hypothetical protein